MHLLDQPTKNIILVWPETLNPQVRIDEVSNFRVGIVIYMINTILNIALGLEIKCCRMSMGLLTLKFIIKR